jgi:large subunit ribosomal protein L13
MMKTANKCYLATRAEAEASRRWFVVDATDQVLGRLASRLATVLMGKNKPTYTPHVDGGDFVIVLNAGKIKLTGMKKKEEIVYQRYSGYAGGLSEVPLTRMIERHPERVIREAVRRMLPKSTLGRHMLSKLKVYAGATHEHQAQQPEPLPLL